MVFGLSGAAFLLHSDSAQLWSAKVAAGTLIVLVIAAIGFRDYEGAEAGSSMAAGGGHDRSVPGHRRWPGTLRTIRRPVHAA